MSNRKYSLNPGPKKSKKNKKESNLWSDMQPMWQTKPRQMDEEEVKLQQRYDELFRYWKEALKKKAEENKLTFKDIFKPPFKKDSHSSYIWSIHNFVKDLEELSAFTDYAADSTDTDSQSSVSKSVKEKEKDFTQEVMCLSDLRGHGDENFYKKRDEIFSRVVFCLNNQDKKDSEEFKKNAFEKEQIVEVDKERCLLKIKDEFTIQLEVRATGFLTGSGYGALNLDDKFAYSLQDDFLNWILETIIK